LTSFGEVPRPAPEVATDEITEDNFNDYSTNSADYLGNYRNSLPDSKIWAKIASTWDDNRKAEMGAIALGLSTFIYLVRQSYKGDSDANGKKLTLSQFTVTKTPGYGNGATGYDYRYMATYPASEPAEEYPQSGGEEPPTEYIEITGLLRGPAAVKEDATSHRITQKVRRYAKLGDQHDFLAIAVNFPRKEIYFGRLPLAGGTTTGGE